MDYFDDDDLINDYMEDDFEPPPEEEFPEEFLTESVVEQSEQTTLTDPIVPVRALPTSAEIASSEWSVDRNQATDPSVTSIVGGEIDVPSISSRRRDDPYSFERYASCTCRFSDHNGICASHFIAGTATVASGDKSETKSPLKSESGSETKLHHREPHGVNRQHLVHCFRAITHNSWRP